MPKKTKDAEADFTQRMLMSLVVDMHHLCETVERTKVQVFAMAKENGVPIPKWDD
ncbi:hypothetical protein [Nitrobacter sp. JJSN]|uniref:hypothetical protein n=1 Tax=Nitrobacter sp. JJSN TaxID=3453033 RepID=UPI003F76376A